VHRRERFEYAPRQTTIRRYAFTVLVIVASAPAVDARVPTLAAPQPFSLPGGQCWQAAFSAADATRNDGTQFSGKGVSLP
jgi:hypothetical protein